MGRRRFSPSPTQPQGHGGDVLEVHNDAIVASHNAVNLGLDFFLV
jgi:hypothetical protein